MQYIYIYIIVDILTSISVGIKLYNFQTEELLPSRFRISMHIKHLKSVFTKQLDQKCMVKLTYKMLVNFIYSRLN